MQDTDESPWDESPPGGGGMTHIAEAEWTKLSSSFQNAGYREGITAGKESALQEGFDKGFAQTGGPLGRELGLLRGVASALFLHLSQSQSQSQSQHNDNVEEPHAESAGAGGAGASANVVQEAREIVDALAAVRFTDIAPSLDDDDEEGHAHCVEDLKKAKKSSGRDEEEEEEEEAGEEDVTSPNLRSAAAAAGHSHGSVATKTTTIEDVRALRVKLETLLCESGLKIDLNLEIF